MIQTNQRFLVAAAVALVVLVAAPAALAETTLPHTFKPNTTASAGQVNNNFAALATAIDQNAPSVYSATLADGKSVGLTDANVHQVSSLDVNCASSGSVLLVASGYAGSNDIDIVDLGIGTSSAALDAPFTRMTLLSTGPKRGTPLPMPFTFSIVRKVGAGRSTFYLNAQVETVAEVTPSVVVFPVTFSAVCIRSPTS